MRGEEEVVEVVLVVMEGDVEVEVEEVLVVEDEEEVEVAVDSEEVDLVRFCSYIPLYTLQYTYVPLNKDNLQIRKKNVAVPNTFII